MKPNINAVKREVEIVFGITPANTITAINSLKLDKLYERFSTALDKAKARYKGYNDETVKEQQLKWASDYLECFSLGSPYHLLLTKYIGYIENFKDFYFEKDLAEARKISDLSDRLFFWQERLNDYYRLVKYKEGNNTINLEVSLNSPFANYSEAVLHELAMIEKHQKQKQSISIKALAPDVNSFFNRVMQCELTETETILSVKELTNNLKPKEAQTLYDDFAFFLFNQKENREADFNQTDIEAAINLLKKNKKPIPYKQIPDLIIKGNVKAKGGKIIDLEKLLYPLDFLCCYQFQSLLKKLIEDASKNSSLRSSKPNKPNISYIWQGNAEKELPKLYQRLVKAEMIDGQTDLKDFRATFTGQPTANIKPIKWIAQTNLLAYFLWSKFNSVNWANIAGKGKLFTKGGKPVSTNTLSVAKSQCMSFEKPPKGYKKIDEILSDIQKQ